MISLKDEIKRFENMVYNKQLAQFVTVDQNFVGGGIRIQSMIHESNFIVEELKKMNSVFLNYCKLNEKVYNKIMEHELNLHVEQGRLNSLTVSLDRKIDDMTKSMKELHANTVQQNQKSMAVIQTVTFPLKEQLDKKIDKTTFELQMKKVLEEYDEGTLAKDEGHEGLADDRLSNGSSNGGGLSGLTAEGLPIIKKKGKVSYDDFYRLQAQIHNKMKASEAKLQETASEAYEGKQLILKYIPTINKGASQLSIHTTQIYKLNHDVLEQQNQFTSLVNKLQQELNNKTSDQYWSIKLEAFFQKQIKPIITTIQQNVKNGQKQFKKYKQQSQRKFIAIDEEFSKTKSAIYSTDSVVKRHTKQIEQIIENIRQNHEEFCDQREKNERFLDQLKFDLGKRIQNLQRSVKAQTQQLRNTIQNLVNIIEESVLKNVNKRVQLQLKTIQSQIRMNKDKIKGLRNDMGIICQEIKNVKDILSKKANFTDIIHQVERKADREDFRQLQSKMQETSQQFVSKNLNESINFSRVQKPERIRANSTTRTNKTLVPPRSATNRMNKTDLQAGTKIFMCGIDGGIGECRGIASQNSRRKSIKSSAAVISDFIL